MEISDYVVIIGMLGAASVLVVATVVSREKKRVESGKLILELLKPLKDNKFKILLSQISDPNVKKYDSKEIEEFLNHFEDIATFWRNGELLKNHMIEFFGENLKSIRDDEFIQNFITSANKNPNIFYFKNLGKLIQDLTNERKI